MMYIWGMLVWIFQATILFNLEKMRKESNDDSSNIFILISMLVIIIMQIMLYSYAIQYLLYR